eukprot:gene10888-3592_t
MYFVWKLLIYVYRFLKSFYAIPIQNNENLKIPKHLSICISKEYSKNLNEIRNIIQWAEELKIPLISIYDKKGVIEPNTFQNHFTFENSSKPKILELSKEKKLNDTYFIEPDLLIIYSKPFVLNEYPPLHLRFTEI